MKKLIFAMIAIIAVFALAGCSEASDPPSAPTDPAVTGVTVNPDTVTLKPGENSRAFSAVVEPDGKVSPLVTWSLVKSDSDDAFTATGISWNEASKEVRTTASAANATFRVKATSSANPAKFGYATVTVQKDVTETNITVTVTPSDVTLDAGDTTEDAFTATVNGSSNSSVTWSLVSETTLGAVPEEVAELTDENKVTVSADSYGVKFRVRAVSDADPSVSGYALITVNPKPDVVETGIEVDASELTTTFTLGDTFDPAGIKVTLKRENDADVVLNAGELAKVTYSPTLLNKAGQFEITAKYKTFTKEFNVTVNKKTYLASDFEITHEGLRNLHQNIKNAFVPITFQANDITAGSITAFYDTLSAPDKAGEFGITIDVTATDEYNAASGLVMTEKLVIANATLNRNDLTVVENTAFADGQVETGDVSTKLVVNWAESTIWNNQGKATINVVYKDKTGQNQTTLPATVGEFYNVYAVVPKETDAYHEGAEISLFQIEVVTSRSPRGNANVTIEDWEFDDKAPVIQGGEISKYGKGENKTTEAKITITGTFDTIEWYLDNKIDTTNVDASGKEYTFKAGNLGLGGPFMVTVRVEVSGEWFSRTVSFTVAP